MESKKTKVCSRCRQEKSVEEFAKKKQSKDGLQYMCKDCMRELNRELYLKRKMNSEDFPKESVSISNLHHVYTNVELAKFKPKDLIAELRARGYTGELRYTQKIIV